MWVSKTDTAIDLVLHVVGTAIEEFNYSVVRKERVTFRDFSEKRVFIKHVAKK